MCLHLSVGGVPVKNLIVTSKSNRETTMYEETMLFRFILLKNRVSLNDWVGYSTVDQKVTLSHLEPLSVLVV